MAANILVIEYRPSDAQEAQRAEQWAERAEQIAAISGLRWKYWLQEPQTGMRGGIYLFDDRSSAEAARGILTGGLIQGGAGDVVGTIYDVDRDLSAITKGVL